MPYTGLTLGTLGGSLFFWIAWQIITRLWR